MRDYVCKPPAGNTRLYCTMIRRSVSSSEALAAAQSHSGHRHNNGDPDGSSSNEDASLMENNPTMMTTNHQQIPPEESNSLDSGVAFTLYLEFLGGLVPLLKGKPTSRLKPEFIIYDPYADQPAPTKRRIVPPPHPSGSSVLMNGTSRIGQFLSPVVQRKKFLRPSPMPVTRDLSDSEPEESCVSTPRLPRKLGRVRPTPGYRGPAPVCPEITPQVAGPSPLLAQVASNIWGTKFRITGLCPASLPAHLGQVTYKTSLLHLQPRQMTLGVVDLRDPPHPPASSAHHPSEEEDGDGLSASEPEEVGSSPSAITRDPLCGEASVAPALTPNLSRLRRRRNNPEPPPSPTHQRRQRVMVPAGSLHQEETIRVEWTGAPPNGQRIVLAGPPPPPPPPPAVRLLKWRSLSADGNLLALTGPSTRRKSRSLDSSPVLAVGRDISSLPLAGQASSNPANAVQRPGIRRSWAVQQTSRTTSRTNRAGSAGPAPPTVESHPQQQSNGTREKGHQRLAAGLARLSPLLSRKLLGAGRASEPSTPSSSPATSRRSGKRPTDRHSSPIRQLLNSPLLARRLGRFASNNNSRPAAEPDSSDDELFPSPSSKTSYAGPSSSSAATTANNYEDLESFQKAQLLNKLRQTWAEEKVMASKAAAAGGSSDGSLSAPSDGTGGPVPEKEMPQRREFILTNKAPLWNEHSQVYQLDFGGRVTQESAKNFQIEFKGKQVRSTVQNFKVTSRLVEL